LGIETLTREHLTKIDRKRKKKGSNADWYNPNDPDAKITKMKDGRTHPARKPERAVDMDTGAIVAITVQGATEGDTSTLEGTLEAAEHNLDEAREHAGDESKRAHDPEEVVADKGYRSKMVMLTLRLAGSCGYIAEPRRKRQGWEDQAAEQAAVYTDRRRKDDARGLGWIRLHGEIIERAFAHAFETGEMRRTHLRQHDNIAKQLLLNIAGFNLGLLMRDRFGMGKPRCLQGRPAALGAAFVTLSDLVASLMRLPGTADQENQPAPVQLPVLWPAHAAV
jgi:transposase